MEPTSSALQTAEVVAKRTRVCRAYFVKWPSGASPYSTYPFALHDTLQLPWDVQITNGIITLRSRFCKKVAQLAAEDICWGCKNLARNTVLLAIVKRVNHMPENLRLEYQPIGGLIEIVRRKTKRIEVLQLKQLNREKALRGKVQQLDDHKRAILAISDGSIERVNVVVRNWVKSKRSINGLIQMLGDAATGLYAPKSLGEKEKLLGLLFLKLGGAAVAELAHRSLGLPAVSTLRQHIFVQPICVSPGQPTMEEILHNISIYFNQADDTLTFDEPFELMIDELRVEVQGRTTSGRVPPDSNWH